MATSTLRGLILVALVVLGVLGLTRLFPQNASLGVTPSSGETRTTMSPTPSPTLSVSPSPAGKPRAKKQVAVRVLNGSTRNLFAALVSDALRSEGYKMGDPGNYSRQVATTIIFYAADSIAEAQRLQQQRFTSAVLRAAPASFPTNLDLQVVLGADAAATFSP